MGRLRLDIVNDEMVVVLKATADVENGAFGVIGEIVDVDTLDRETYELNKFEGGEGAGEVVFVAHDGHRYDEKDNGFDVKVAKDELTRGYHLSRRDLISVEPKVLLGEGVTAQVGDYLIPKAGSFCLEVGSKDVAIAKIDGKEMYCGYEVYLVRFL